MVVLCRRYGLTPAELAAVCHQLGAEVEHPPRRGRRLPRHLRPQRRAGPDARHADSQGPEKPGGGPASGTMNMPRAAARVVAAHAADAGDELLLLDALGLGDVWRLHWVRTVRLGRAGSVTVTIEVADVRWLTTEDAAYVAELVRTVLAFERTVTTTS